MMMALTCYVRMLARKTTPGALRGIKKIVVEVASVKWRGC